jgi:glycosyltransferase involved in cell wall biosynthesis
VLDFLGASNLACLNPALHQEWKRMSLPLVSVVIPTFNGAHFLEETIGSVLRQDYPSFEILVVDDGSTDKTQEVLASFGERVTVILGSHQGVAAARNLALDRARGEYVAFLDYDDIWVAGKLKRQVEMLISGPFDFVYTDAEEFNSAGVIHASFFSNFPLLREPGRVVESLTDRSIPLTSTVVVRRELLERFRLRFNPQAVVAEDVGFFLEIAARGGRFGVIPEQLTRRRLHDSNISAHHLNRFIYRVIVFTDILARYGEADRDYLACVRRGLRLANYRVGEGRWAELQLRDARNTSRRHGARIALESEHFSIGV